MTRALSSVPGVRNVTVDFDHREATVEADPCDTEALIAALGRDGYKGTVKATP